jgi:hypothetical protein
VTLNKEFFKAFNGPCFNEAIVMNLLGIHIDEYTITEGKPADIYVGMEFTENYQNARTTNIGIGTMYGNKPNQPLKPGTGHSNPVDNAGPGGSVDTHPSDNPGDNGNNNAP